MSSQAQDISTPVGDNLRAEMQRVGLNLTQTAGALDVSRRQINRWLGGQEPRYEFVRRMADHFGRDPQWFYTEHEEAA